MADDNDAATPTPADRRERRADARDVTPDAAVEQAMARQNVRTGAGHAPTPAEAGPTAHRKAPRASRVVAALILGLVVLAIVLMVSFA